MLAYLLPAIKPVISADVRYAQSFSVWSDDTADLARDAPRSPFVIVPIRPGCASPAHITARPASCVHDIIRRLLEASIWLRAASRG